MYCESTLRRKAKAIDLYVHKGFQHYFYDGEQTVFYTQNGERIVGYSITDLTTGFDIWPSFDSNFDNLLTLEDVEQILKKRYEEIGLEF